jgi:thioesterase domain-containing protein
LGDSVALLAVFDTPTFRPARRTPGWQSRALAGVRADLTAYLAHALQPGQRLRFLRRELAAVGPVLAWALRLSKTVPHMQELEALVEGVADASAAHHRVARAHLQALARHRPRPFQGQVTLFRARLRPLFSSHDPTLGWDQLALGGVEVRPISGTHHEMFDAAHVDELARELRTLLGSTVR